MLAPDDPDPERRAPEADEEEDREAEELSAHALRCIDAAVRYPPARRVHLVAENLTRSFGTAAGRRAALLRASAPGTGPRRRRAERQREDDAREDPRGPASAPPPGSVFLDAGAGPGALAARRLRRRSAGCAPDLALYGELTAAENLRFFARLHGRPVAAPAGPSGGSPRVGLDPSRIAATPLRALSTGQRQRVKLVYATLHEPAVLFLDEPSSNLDEAGPGGRRAGRRGAARAGRRRRRLERPGRSRPRRREGDSVSGARRARGLRRRGRLRQGPTIRVADARRRRTPSSSSPSPSSSSSATPSARPASRPRTARPSTRSSSGSSSSSRR